MSQLNNIYLSQKRAIRLICNLKPLDHTSESYLNLKIMDIKIIYTYFVSIFVFKFIHNQLPPFFKDFYSLSISIQLTFTIQTSIFYTYKSRPKLISISLKHTGPKIWTKLPPFLKTINFLPRFKKELHHFLTDSKNLNNLEY